ATTAPTARRRRSQRRSSWRRRRATRSRSCSASTSSSGVVRWATIGGRPAAPAAGGAPRGSRAGGRGGGRGEGGGGGGTPAAGLIQVAEERGARMIVVGTRGEGLVKSVLVGSTSQKLLHRSSVPVLVVPEG